MLYYNNPAPRQIRYLSQTIKFNQSRYNYANQREPTVLKTDAIPIPTPPNVTNQRNHSSHVHSVSKCQQKSLSLKVMVVGVKWEGVVIGPKRIKNCAPPNW